MLQQAYNRLIAFLIISSILLVQIQTNSTNIPLAYALDPYSTRKYPIKLSFNQSYTTVPFSSQYLPLYNINITMDLKTTSSTNQTQSSQNNNKNNAINSNNNNDISTQSVTIGLKPPSIFLAAVQSSFNIEPHQIQLGKIQYLQLIINDNNFVQSTDEFTNNQIYTVKVMYNYGGNTQIKQQRCELIDEDIVYFDQFLILQILNGMDKRNKIKYKKDQVFNKIYIEGDILNFPKISFTKDKSIFEIQIKSAVLSYLPRADNSSQAYTQIGYKSLTQFSKFQIDPNTVTVYYPSPSGVHSLVSTKNSSQTSAKIIFKRTSQLYQLYLFLGYFFVFTLIFIILARTKLEGSMKFIRNVVQWVFMNNPNARIRVLRTQLQ